MKEYGHLQKETDTLKKEVKVRTFEFGYLSEGDSNKWTTFYTGIPNFKTFMWLVSFLHSSLPVFTSVCSKDTVLIVLMKLQLNLQKNYDLVTQFIISSTTVSDI
jgi:hypothetical protein